ncbi:MAG: hypothetical protein RJA81_2449, partial [Planctomycetota bacterium]
MNPIIRRRFLQSVALTGLSSALPKPMAAGNSSTMTARSLIEEHEREIRPLEIKSGLTWWKANVTGKDEDFQAKEIAQNALDEALADRERFAAIKAVRESGPSDPLERRQIELLYLQALEKQVDPKLLAQITNKANAIEKAFNTFRARPGDRVLTDSQVRDI